MESTIPPTSQGRHICTTGIKNTGIKVSNFIIKWSMKDFDLAGWPKSIRRNCLTMLFPLWMRKIIDQEFWRLFYVFGESGRYTIRISLSLASTVSCFAMLYNKVEKTLSGLMLHCMGLKFRGVTDHNGDYDVILA